MDLDQQFIDQINEGLLHHQSLSKEDRASIKGMTILYSIQQLCEKWLETVDTQNPERYSRHRQQILNLLKAIRAEIRAWSGSAPLNESTVEIGEAIGTGAITSVSNVTITTPSGGSFEAVHKAESSTMIKNPDGTEKKQATAAGLIGLPKYGARLSNRAFASSLIDRAVGTFVLPYIELAITKNEEGEFELSQIMEKIEAPNLEEISLEERAELFKRGGVRRDLFHLQLIDYLTEQVDRHRSNIKLSTYYAVGIDNDFAFGSINLEEFDDEELKALRKMGLYNKGLPKYIGADVAARVLAMEHQDIWELLDGLLTPLEIQKTVLRLHHLKAAIQDGTIQLISQDLEWGLLPDETIPENSYFYRT